MTKTIVIAGQLRGLNTLADGTLKLTFMSQELTPEIAGRVYEIRNQYCYMAVKAEGFSDEELKAIEEADTDFKTAKSPSQKLRGVLYRFFEQDPQGFSSFDRFYIHHLDQITEHYKGKLK